MLRDVGLAAIVAWTQLAVFQAGADAGVTDPGVHLACPAGPGVRDGGLTHYSGGNRRGSPQSIARDTAAVSGEAILPACVLNDGRLAVAPSTLNPWNTASWLVYPWERATSPAASILLASGAGSPGAAATQPHQAQPDDGKMLKAAKNGYILRFSELPVASRLATDKIKHRDKVRLEHENKISKISRLTNRSLQIKHEYCVATNGIAVDLTDQEAGELQRMEGVTVYPNSRVEILMQDSVQITEAVNAWAMDRGGGSCSGIDGDCLTGSNITIAFVDSGIDYTHPDFGSCTYEQVMLGNCRISGYDIASHEPDMMDENGHGTHVAGIAAAKGDYNGNNIYEPELGEVWGNAPDANILMYKAMDASGGGYVDDILTGIELAIDNNYDGDPTDHADVLSLSVGVSCGSYSEICGPDDLLSSAVDNAVDAGTVVVVAAGNCGPAGSTTRCVRRGEESILSPGTARNAITVGNITKSDGTWLTSSRGPVIYNGERIEKPDVVAPGAMICSTELGDYFYFNRCIDNRHVTNSGTSMAAPQVAGVAALLRQAHPEMSPFEIKDRIKNSAVRLGDTNIYGAGKVNARRALTKYMGDTNNDGTVDVVDLLTLVEGWGTTIEDAGYSQEADLNMDGSVDVVDLLYLCQDWSRLHGRND